jgi:hypothetical protein
LFLFFEDRIELRAGHLQLVRMFVDPFGQGIILGGSPTSFEFGAVLSQAIEFEVEGIFEVGEFRGDDCLLGEDGGGAGMIKVPNGPGLRLDLSEDFLRKNMMPGETYWS